MRTPDLGRVHRVTESDLTHNDVHELLRGAIREKLAAGAEYVWIRDVADDWVAYEVEGDSGCDTYKVGYAVDAVSREVTFAGSPEKVVLRTTYENVTEAGRVLEAKGTARDGGRVFRVRIISVGTSRNGVRYTESVLRAAAPLYEGAKAYDHHRTAEELETSTIAGLVGHYANVSASSLGIDADLNLLPSAAHTAEALDASLTAQATGLAPLVGISHDVAMTSQPATEAGRSIREATAIRAVLSADVVADPSAGGHATRMVAGGITNPNTTIPEEGPMKLKELLAKLRTATAEERAALLLEHAAVLEAAGYTEADVDGLIAAPAAETETTDDTGKELVGAGVGAGAESVTESRRTEASMVHHRESAMGRLLIRSSITDAGLDPDGWGPLVSAELPDRFSEADLSQTIARTRRAVEAAEKSRLVPSVPHVAVGDEDRDKLSARIDRTLEGNYRDGFRSLRQMWATCTGATTVDLLDGDVPSMILRECFGTGRYEGRRQRESVETTTFGEILGDSVARRMIAEYNAPALSLWREIVSSITPVNDFRTQRRERMGGYGTLSTVSQANPYQALTTPADEEATYAITKKGGTEDLTIEAIANDDLGALRKIPQKLGRAAAQTLYRFVLELLNANATCTYDSVALYHSGSHGNTDTSSALTQTTLSVGRRKMIEQAAYGDTSDILGILPKFLLVPPELEEIAFQLCTSAVAIPSTPAGPSDAPNIHQGLLPRVVPYWTDANDWHLVADPASVPTIEVGFYQGKEEPELFVQDNPQIGSVFDADKITYKIRHIYSGAVLDHRGFYRGQG